MLWTAILIDVGGKLLLHDTKRMSGGVGYKEPFEIFYRGEEDRNFSEPSFKDVIIKLTNFEDSSKR